MPLELVVSQKAPTNVDGLSVHVFDVTLIAFITWQIAVGCFFILPTMWATWPWAGSVKYKDVSCLGKGLG